MAASDSVIWEIINTQFCAFKIQYVSPGCSPVMIALSLTLRPPFPARTRSRHFAEMR
jgi:hypothetical protein